MQSWSVRGLNVLHCPDSPLSDHAHFFGVSDPLGHPFDLTKTRLQTAAPGTYTGGLDVVKKTLARDGPTGLYRGVVPPLLGVTPIFALSFWVPFFTQAIRVLLRSLTPLARLRHTMLPSD